LTLFEGEGFFRHSQRAPILRKVGAFSHAPDEFPPTGQKTPKNAHLILVATH
jgi:hypothetical protein